MHALIVMLLLLAPSLMASELFNQLVGQDAPDFDARTCVNKPADSTLEACKGNVILIKFWGPA
ncbi:MAG: hypothetical protein ACYTDT_04360 [Planctomycetota bacterium]